MKSKNVFKKGFTLIELLIVITIIGILAAALLPSILGAPARARDLARQGHLNQIAAAIEAYSLDGNAYPGDLGTPICINSSNDAFNAIADNLQGGQLPKDPSKTDILASCSTGEGDYVYVKIDNQTGANYVLYSEVENTSNGNYSIEPDGVQAVDGGVDTKATGTYYIIIK